MQGRHAEALVHFQAAVKWNPESVAALVGMALTLQFLGDHESALQTYAQGLQRNPHDATLRMQRGMLLLRLGRFQEGWRDYESRLRLLPVTRDWIDKAPIWDGQPVKNKSIVVHCEQGIGDTLQFLRFLPLVKQQCLKTILLCQPPLGPLLKLNRVADEIVDQHSNRVVADRYIPLGSLPGLLQVNIADIPKPPYLSAASSLIDRWRPRIEALPGFKVGIVWQGSSLNAANQRRSIPRSEFAALSSVPGIQLISLQKGALESHSVEGGEAMQSSELQPNSGTKRHALVRERSPLEMVDFGSDLDEATGPFMDTAAIMQHLDLVISIDSAVGHLAGAMGIPTWLLLPEVADWRWMLEHSDSPWYPTLRLFRKTRGETWTDVMRKVASELARAVGSLGSVGQPKLPDGQNAKD